MPLIVEISAPSALLVEQASTFGAAFAVMSGIGASCLRAWAVLREKPAEKIDRWTVLGFLLGGACMILFVFIDPIARAG